MHPKSISILFIILSLAACNKDYGAIEKELESLTLAVEALSLEMRTKETNILVRVKNEIDLANQAVEDENTLGIEVLEEQWNISLSVLELYMRTQDHEHAQDGKCLD